MELVRNPAGPHHPWWRSVGTTARHPNTRLVIVAGVFASLTTSATSCTHPRQAPAPSTATNPTRAPTATSVDIAAACRHPDTIASTSRHVGVGNPNAPTIGPLSFHPYPYWAGDPTKMIIHAERDLTRPVVLRGYRCSDQHALRFAQYPDLPTTPPYTAQQLQTLGSPTAYEAPMPAGGDHGGYALFSSTGQWLIIVTEGSTTLGVLRVDIAHEHES
jgi:hypothetical protein